MTLSQVRTIVILPLILFLLLTLHGQTAVAAASKFNNSAANTRKHKYDYQLVQQQALASIPCDETLGMAGPYPCQNIDLLGFVPTTTLVGSTGADIWGWTDPVTGQEMAIQSLSNATAFVDVSDPANPIFLGHLPAPVPNILWRDAKVHNNHAYIVGDGDFVLPHGLQIFDLTQLRDVTTSPAIFADTARIPTFGNAHNIAINEDTGFAYVVGSNLCSGGLLMMDLQNATNPSVAGCYSADGYTHDTQCVIYNGLDADHQGREICFNSNEDTLTIVDVSDKNTPVQLSRTPYAGSSYTHQGWLTENHAYFVLGDELDEQNFGHNTKSYIWDVGDLDAPVLIGFHLGRTTAIDHNLYIRDGYIFQSNYTAGLEILDASDIANGNLSLVAYFDTHPSSNVAQFAGTWSNYAFFESGIVVVSNIEDGLYILQPHLDGNGGDPEPPTGGGKATGGGWLADNSGKKINVGFNVEGTADSLTGDLKLNDKTAGVKIHLDNLTAIGAATENCNDISGSNALEFHGNGTYNDDSAGFRVCVQDNSEPGKGSDQFYLECLSGCDYNTADHTPDNTIDGGNIQVQQGTPSSSTNSSASTLILDPLLLSEGVIGQAQLFSVTAYDQDQNRLSGTAIALNRIAAGGAVETLTAVTDITGMATFIMVNLNQEVEYIATAANVESNGIVTSPIMP